jgi:hypothetical protein
MSKIEVNTVAPQCGTTLTLGESGDTVTLGTGASQSGFGRTGTVDWQTGDIKTGDFTAVNTQGFFVDTNSGEVEATLPAGSAGSIISFQDYRNTFDTATLTITPNGSQKINGGTGGGSIILNTEGEGITLVYIDSTVGWRSIQDNVFADVGNNFISATGGTISCSGNCRIHTFTGPGTFAVSSLAVCSANNALSHLVLAGGGGGGGEEGGGGGAGGYREVKSPTTPYTASPLDGYPSAPNRITATVASFPITVGAGGAGQTLDCTPASSGASSIFSTITSAGGGFGGGQTSGNLTGQPGGSGGGGHGDGPGAPKVGGNGNTPPTTPAQGTNGGAGIGRSGTTNEAAGGGGGATAAGTGGSNSPNPGGTGGPGGAGATTSISGSPVARGGGGGGAATTSSGVIGTGGTGGGGDATKNNTTGAAGTANTGGGGGGGGGNGGASGGAKGGAGGSGVVIIRYKFQ